jgi:murein L,D-transpeptidase YcbB/YkuD
VRLADAGELGQRFFGRTLVADPATGPEQRIDRASPAPAYVLYLTVQPGPAGIVQLPDVYGRDPALPAVARPSVLQTDN